MWLSAHESQLTSECLSLLLLLRFVVLVHLRVIQIILISSLLCAVSIAIVGLDPVHDLVGIRILKMCNVK